MQLTDLVAAAPPGKPGSGATADRESGQSGTAAEFGQAMASSMSGAEETADAPMIEPEGAAGASDNQAGAASQTGAERAIPTGLLLPVISAATPVAPVIDTAPDAALSGRPVPGALPVTEPSAATLASPARGGDTPLSPMVPGAGVSRAMLVPDRAYTPVDGNAAPGRSALPDGPAPGSGPGVAPARPDGAVSPEARRQAAAGRQTATSATRAPPPDGPAPQARAPLPDKTAVPGVVRPPVAAARETEGRARHRSPPPSLVAQHPEEARNTRGRTTTPAAAQSGTTPGPVVVRALSGHHDPAGNGLPFGGTLFDAAGAGPALPVPVSPALSQTPQMPLAQAGIADRGVVAQISHAVPPGTPPGTIDLTLDPPELGRIEIVIELAEQSIRATVSADRTSTGELIRRNLDQLADQFRDAGFDDVDLSFAERQPDDRRGPGTGQSEDAPDRNDHGEVAARPARNRPAGTGAGMDLRL